MKKQIKSLYKFNEQERQALNMTYKKPQIYMNRVAAIVLCQNGGIIVIHNPMNCDFSGWDSVIKVGCGKNHLVGLCSDGTVLSVGDNTDGQCDVAAWRDIMDIAAFDNMTVGLSASGESLIKGRITPSETPAITTDIRALTNTLHELRQELTQEREKISQLEEQVKKLLKMSADTKESSAAEAKSFELSVLVSNIKMTYDILHSRGLNNVQSKDKYTDKRLDGRYEIQELIGVGGMAAVYKAYDNLDEKFIAVKIFKDEFLDNKEFIRRFENESKAIAVLSHPNIVKVYDVSFGDRIQYIVMEYIDGITLREYIEQQHVISWKEAVHFTVQILQALQHAHEKGIVHRDVKPQNIMLLQDGTIKVTDFGIARISNGETKTITNKAIGSVHYIAPEQAKGGVTDGKADIYSVGVMLYEMLTGKLPFDADSVVSVSIMQLQNEPKPLREINENVPEGLEEITLRAMRKNPTQRYQSAKEMLEAIETFRKNSFAKNLESDSVGSPVVDKQDTLKKRRLFGWLSPEHYEPHND